MTRDSGFFGGRPGIIYLAETVCLSEYATSDVAGGIWAGIRALPEEQDVDLLACCGDIRLAGVPSIAHHLIHPGAADGFLIWRPRSGADCTDYFRQFADSPLVYLSTAHSPKPVEIIQGESQMRALVHHLVQQHGCRKIAYIPGPPEHSYSKQRLAGYLTGLQEVGIEPDQALIAPPGAWTQEAGELGARILLDERGLRPGLDVDAIMCVSDQVAMGVFLVLEQQGVVIPGQIKLTGFNNVREARYHFPSLTTVAMPFAQQARRGMCRLLFQMGQGPDIENEPESKPYLLIGESCGCGNPHLIELYSGEMASGQDEDTPPDLSRLQLRLFDHLCETLPYREASRVADEIWHAALNAVQSGKPGRVLSLIMPWIRTGYLGLVDQLFWQQFWGDFRWHFEDDPGGEHAGRALEILRNTTVELYIREQGKQALWETHVANILRILSLELTLAPDMAALQALLQKNLYAIDIHSCWLVLYDEPVMQSEPPLQARLMLAVENSERHDLPVGGVPFPVRQLIAPGYRRAEKAGAFISFPVMQREYEYGYVIVNHSRSTNWGEMLSDLIGSAVRSLRLRDELASQKQQLEHFYKELLSAQQRIIETDKMAALGELVAGIAHEINTPIGVGVTAISTLTEDIQYLADLVERRQAGPIPALVRHIREGADITMRNLERSAQLIESFKQIAVDQSRAESRTINLSHYVQDIVRSVMPRLRSGGHEVEIACPDDLETTCDPSVITRILTNLIINSLLHGFENRRNGHIGISFSRDGQGLLLDYRDDGKGMPDEVREKMFLPFFTTKRGQGGTGLGMHIVYNLVTQGLHGTIHCESASDAGVHFRITFPSSATG